MLRCCVKGVVVALVGFPISPCFAADDLSGAVGRYETKGAYSQTLKIDRSRSAGRYAGSFMVVTRGCVGEAKVTGQAAGPRRIVFTERDESLGICRLTATFSGDFRSVTIAEENCHMHGASCSFEGTLKRRGR